MLLKILKKIKDKQTHSLYKYCIHMTIIEFDVSNLYIKKFTDTCFFST
jgi:hypothetical protein